MTDDDPWATFPDDARSASTPPPGVAADSWSSFPDGVTLKPGAQRTPFKVISPGQQPPDAAGPLKQFGVGAARGAIDLAGLPGDAAQGSRDATAWTIEKLHGKPEADMYRAFVALHSVPLPTSSAIQANTESVTGPFRQPQNPAEAYADTIGSFTLPALVTGPEAAGAGAARRLGANFIRGAAVPGVAAETAGQFSAGLPAEPYLRALAAVGGGGAGALLENTQTTAAKLKARLPASVTPSVVDDAKALIDRSAALPGGGIKLTWSEALSKVAGQGVFAPIQRVLENDPKTAGLFQPMMSARPGEVESVGRSMLDTVAPRPPAPATIGPQAADAAQGVLGDIRGAVNRATKPLYDASAQTLVPIGVHTHMMTNEVFADALSRVRNDSTKNMKLVGQSDRSIAVYDAVKKELQEAADNAANPTSQFRSQQSSANLGTVAGQTKQAAIDADRASTGGPSTYEAALGTQARMRSQYLDPVLQGPVGKIADQPETKRAVSALFPTAPLEGSEKEVGAAVAALAGKNPDAARALVRAHMASVFDKATTDLTGGPNQWGGARYAASLAGGLQQRLNLEAAVNALPGNADGKVWGGISNALDAMRATGMRLPPNSATEFNRLEGNQFSYGGKIVAAAKLLGAPERAINVIGDKITSWQMAGNKTEIAQILTDPRSAPLLRQIAGLPSQSDRAAAIMARLFSLGVIGRVSPQGAAAAPQ